MKKKIPLLLIGILLIFNPYTFSQNVAGTAVNPSEKNPYKKYLRPSITVILVDRADDRSRRIQKIFELAKVPEKYNDNNIATRVVQGNTISFNFAKDFEKNLTENISREIVARWFSRNTKGEFSMDLISERGLYNATDADLIKAKASQRKMDLLRDAGENLLDRSYILVYDIFNIKSLSEAGNTSGVFGEKEGYQCEFKTYLYKLDWNDSVAALFYNNLWVDANGFDSNKAEAFNKSTFPIKLIGEARVTLNRVESSQFKDLTTKDTKLSDEQLFAGLYDQIMTNSSIGLSNLNEDFKVKAPIYSTSPITAKIGLKEGLSVDRRFFAYEMRFGKDGKRKAVRKGVVRASGQIADNRGMATGESGTSRFYQIAGGSLYEGIQLQENPDWGFGVMLGWGNMPGIGEGLHVNAEINVSMWAGKAIKNMVPGVKVYGDYVFTPNLTTNAGIEYEILSGAVGISKDLNFLHHFVLVPFLGVGMEKYTNKNDTSIAYQGLLIQPGCRLGINLKYNIQIMGNASYGTLLNVTTVEGKQGNDFDAQDVLDSRGSAPQLMIGIRYQF